MLAEPKKRSMLRRAMPGMALLSVLLLNGTSWAGEFNSRAGLGLLVMEQADNMSGRGYRVIAGNERPRAFSRLIPIGLLDTRYTWDNSAISFGTAVDDPAGLTLGYRRKLESGAISAGLFYSIFGSEWRNPYLFGTPRVDTTVHTYGARAAWEEIGGQPFTVAIKGTAKRVANEDLTGVLRRDGVLLDTDISYRRRLNEEWSLVPSVSYLRGQYDGSANNFHGGTFGIGAIWSKDNLVITTRLAGTLAEYDREHPVFDQRRHDLGYRFSTLVNWGSPFGWKQWFTSAGIIHSRVDSNIDFFASRATYGYALMGYQF